MYVKSDYKKIATRENLPPIVDMNEGIDMLEGYQEVENGVMLSKIKSVKKRIESPSELSILDFKMENLQAVGADKGLKEFTPIDNINKLEEFIIKLEDKIDSFENDDKVE